MAERRYARMELDELDADWVNETFAPHVPDALWNMLVHCIDSQVIVGYRRAFRISPNGVKWKFGLSSVVCDSCIKLMLRRNFLVEVEVGRFVVNPSMLIRAFEKPFPGWSELFDRYRPDDPVAKRPILSIVLRDVRRSILQERAAAMAFRKKAKPFRNFPTDRH